MRLTCRYQSESVRSNRMSPTVQYAVQALEKREVSGEVRGSDLESRLDISSAD